MNGLTQRRRNKAESLAPAPTVDVVVGQPSNTFKELTTPPKPSKQTIDKPLNDANSSASSVTSSSHEPVKNIVASPRQNNVSAAKLTPDKQSSSGTISNVSSKSQIVPNASQTSLSKTTAGKIDVDSFIPDQNAIDNFLDDDFVSSSNNATFSPNDDDDSDDEHVNPMVAGFTDDLDLDDFKTSVVLDANSSDDDDDGKVAKSNGVVEVELKKVKIKAAKNLFEVPADLSLSSTHQVFAFIFISKYFSL